MKKNHVINRSEFKIYNAMRKDEMYFIKKRINKKINALSKIESASDKSLHFKKVYRSIVNDYRIANAEKKKRLQALARNITS